MPGHRRLLRATRTPLRAASTPRPLPQPHRASGDSLDHDVWAYAAIPSDVVSAFRNLPGVQAAYSGEREISVGVSRQCTSMTSGYVIACPNVRKVYQISVGFRGF